MALALTLALSGVARAAPPAIDPASLTGRLIFIGRDEGQHLPHPIAVGAYSLKLGTKMPTEIPLTPLDRKVWFLARNPAAGDVYYFTSDGVKDNAWYLLKSFDGITDTLDPPHSVSLARYVQSFAVSPDGRYIAGVHKMAGVFHLWIDDLSGTTPSVEIRGQDTWPCHPPIWSPDGKHLIFVGSLGGDLNYSELFGVDPDGSHLRQLTDLPQWVSWWVRL